MSFAKYIGIPYVCKGRALEGVDCWGLVKMVYADLYDIQLPDYSDTYANSEDWESIGGAIQDGLKQSWTLTQTPREGDLIILSVAQRPWHCGVMIDSMRFMHAAPEASVVVERLDTPRWSKRLSGIYRLNSLEISGVDL